jgi:hypothetical protein
MAYFHENQEYHVDAMAPEAEETKTKDSPDVNVTSPKKKYQMQDTIKKEPTSLSQPSLSNSTSEPSTSLPTQARIADVAIPSTTQYKSLLPSRSDASKHSLSINQLTISTSDVQSFVQSSDVSPKLAGEDFLLSKDTDGQHRSNDFDDDEFQSNFDWPPVDAFSPTSWGAGAPGPSTSEDSKWNTVVPDTPNSLTAPVTVDEKIGWDFKTTGPAVEWGEAEEETDRTAKKGWNSSWGKVWDEGNDALFDNRDESISEEAMKEAEARISELSELAGVSGYEGFSGVEHADCPSRMESRDGPSPREDNINVSSPGIESKCSEGTMGTATEFDPISLFEIEKMDSFPACNVEENDASVVSWASAKVLKPHDDSANSAFASLRAGAPMDASTLFGQDKSAVDTPSGKESLGSWWQSRYASTHNNDINAAVQDALNEATSRDEQRSDYATERCDSSKREFATPKNVQQHSGGISNDPLSSRTKYFKPPSPSSPDDDSIFGDLDDDSLGCSKRHTSNNKSGRKSSLSRYGTISNAETDDIFAGVSVSSRQRNQPKESSAIIMKSLLDGSTTTGSQSMHQKTKAGSREPECPLPKVEEQETEPMGLFMMNGTYGVINVKDSGKNSPTASVTSDITTSVIFGGDFGKKRAFPRKGTNLSIDRDIPDSIIEIPDVLSDKPVCSPLNNNTGAHGQDFDDEDTENIDPRDGHCVAAHEAKEFSKDNNRIRSIISETTEEATQQSNPSLLKKALLMVKNGKCLVDDSAKAKSVVSSTSEVGGLKPSLFALPLACGMLGASSFAFCATKGEYLRKEIILSL